MADHNPKGSRIEDNPSAKEILDALLWIKLVKSSPGLMKKLGISSERLDRLHQAVEDVLQQSDVLTLPDRFNDAFAQKGWIATGSMSATTMQRALDLHEAGEHQHAEDEILAWFQEDTINWRAIVRSKSFNKARNRCDQLQEALKLTFEERYWAAVPLILIACDGFASDVLGVGDSLFKEGVDLTVFDSIPGHPSSLPSLIQRLAKSVRKSSDEELTLPLRHGILHGRSLGYANRVVCMKVWLLMIALVDWAHDKTTEKERILEYERQANTSFWDAMEAVRKNGAINRAMEAFEPWKKQGPFEDIADEDSPEFAINEFLTCWKNRNYGKMAEWIENPTKIPIKKMAGQLRQQTESINLLAFEIRSVRQSTIVRTEAVTFLKGRTLQGDVEGKFQVVALRTTAEGGIVPPTDEARWFVQEKCIWDLLSGRTISRDDIQT